MSVYRVNQRGYQPQTRESFTEYVPKRIGWRVAFARLPSGFFIVVRGRLGSIHGHKRGMLIGAAWRTGWSSINAFCANSVAFNVARASRGVGTTTIVPNAIAMISTTLPPGNMRTLSLGCFGAGAPVGGWLGGLLAGLLAELTPSKWLFILM